MAARRSLPGRLLVDLPNWVGDVIMTLPAVGRLAEANSAGTTVLHCRPPVERLLAELFPTATVIASTRRASPLGSALRLTRGGRFGLAVTFRHATRAKLLVRLAARRTLGSRGDGSHVLLSRGFPVDRGRHQVRDMDALLADLMLPPVDASRRPSVPPAVLAEGRAILDCHHVGGDALVGLAPAAGWGLSKRWPAERFGALARLLAERGHAPLVLVGPGEDDVARAVIAAAGRDLPVLGESLDVAALLGVIAGLGAVVGNDSGPMHLAAMAGVPVVALFGPTDPGRTGPLWGEHVIIRLGLECSPCFEPECPLGHHACLDDIEPDAVVAAVERVMVSEDHERTMREVVAEA